MENEIQDIDLNNEVADEVTETVVEESKPEKKQFTPEEQLAIHKRELKRLEKQLGVDKFETESKPKSKSKSDELDYGKVAFHNSKSDSIKLESDADLAFLKETMADTGKSQEAVLSSKWFAEELKERKLADASQNAVPKGKKISTTTNVNEVDYWLAKGEMPVDTPENRELRAKIVNEEIRREKSKSVFGGSSKIIIK